jgi:hypothetical protein
MGTGSSFHSIIVASQSLHRQTNKHLLSMECFETSKSLRGMDIKVLQVEVSDTTMLNKVPIVGQLNKTLSRLASKVK